MIVEFLLLLASISLGYALLGMVAVLLDRIRVRRLYR
jgi:hypothetical protein